MWHADHCGEDLANSHAKGALAKNLQHTCLPQVAMPKGPQPKIFGTLACHRLPCQEGLSQKSSAHLPATRCHAKGALAKNLRHTCLPQGAMPRGPWPKIFGTLACRKVPCQGGLGQKSSAHLPATGCHAKRASAKDLWHTCLPQGAMPRGPWPKIFSTLAYCKVPYQGGPGQNSLAH